MKRDPNHPGANHYYIHAVEASNTPERAAEQARRLETLVPGAGHLVHMPAHIYIRTGQYAQSAKANAVAAAVDEKYFTVSGADRSMYAVMYYGHNLQFESAAAMYAGNLAQARDAARRTVRLADPVADQAPMIEPFANQELIVLVRFEQWSDILGAKAPPATRTVQTALYHYARGAAQAGLGKVDEANATLSELDRAVSAVPKDAMLGPANSAVAMLRVAVADLRGRIATARGDAAGAVREFTAAVAAEDALGYNEPPDWLLPERERLGAAQMRAGQAAAAEATFRADLRHNVGNPRSLFGLWHSLAAQRKSAATDTQRAFEQAWKGADVVLSPAIFESTRASGQ
jgi:hypothetical protein